MVLMAEVLLEVENIIGIQHQEMVGHKEHILLIMVEGPQILE